MGQAERGRKVLSELVRITIALVLSALLGVTSLYTLSGTDGLGAVESGIWRSWKNPADPDSWPYARLHFLLQDRLPPSRFLSTVFIAESDDEGRVLSAACVYRLTGRLPPTRWWSLNIEAVDDDARMQSAASLSSEDAMVLPDGSVTVTISRLFRPGNWLPAPREGHFRIILSLHGVSPLLRERLNTLTMPRIIREGCS